MNTVLHTFRALFQLWKKSREERRGRRAQDLYSVEIDHPRMKIIGTSYPNEIKESNPQYYVAFLGIPYARPPVDELRFKPPQPLPEEDPSRPYEKKAFVCGETSLQRTVEKVVLGSEDCLYLNIYLPRDPNDIRVKLPVLVYIHGGGFFQGTSDIKIVRPDSIVRENLVFVTINYRLGIFGFLNLETDGCRGNQGLKDQVMALRWIKLNIERFGGNPENVTIQGHSAGATSVNLHMISPMSEGLFHRAIVHAGGLYCPWGFLGNEIKVKRLFTQATGREITESIVLTVLKKTEAQEVLRYGSELQDELFQRERKDIALFLGPTKERIKKDAFIPDDIEVLKKKAKPVPLMAGICAGEGYCYVLGQYSRHLEGYGALLADNDKFDIFLRRRFRWSKDSAMAQRDAIRNLYFSNLGEMSRKEIEKRLADLVTCSWFRRFYDNFKIGTTKAKPFYVYKFSYLDEIDRVQIFRVNKNSVISVNLAAPPHSFEMNYLHYPFDYQNRLTKRMRAKPRRIQNIMRKMVSDFCTASVEDLERGIVLRGIEWRPHTEENPCYLNIHNKLKLVEARLNESDWDTVNDIVASEPTMPSPVLTPIGDPDYYGFFKISTVTADV